MGSKKVGSSDSYPSEFKTFVMADGTKKTNPMINIGNLPSFNIEQERGQISTFI